MKTRLLLQLFLFTIILLLYNSLFYLLNYQKNNYIEAISEFPMLIFSYESTNTDTLQNILDTFSFVSKIEIEDTEEITQNLVEYYKLSEADEILMKYSLPSVMKIYFKGEMLGLSEKKELLKILSSFKGKIEWRFNDKYWCHYQKRLDLLENIRSILKYLLFVIFVLFVIIRVHFDKKNDHYWQIYQSAGGNFLERRKIFLIQTVFLSIFAVILKIAVFYSLEYFQYFKFINLTTDKFYIDSSIREIAILIAANSCVAILFRKKL